MDNRSITKPIVFISHVSEEKAVADALAQLIRKQFASLIEVFVSSIPLGTEWFDAIKQALFGCEIAIILASPTSIKRPWINFEAGVVFGQQKTVIPLCHSGMTKAALPSPLNHLQAAAATDPIEMTLVFESIARTFGASVDQINFSTFISAVKIFEAIPKDIPAISKSTTDVPNSADGLNATEVGVLNCAADDESIHSPGVRTSRLTAKLSARGFTNSSVAVAVNTLEKKGFIKNNVGFVEFTQKAWNWVEQHQ